MGAALLRVPDSFAGFKWPSFFDPFAQYVDAGLWTKLASDSGASVAAGDYDGGGVLLTTGATDNNEAMIKTTNKLFTFKDKLAIMAEALLDWTQAATNAANIAFGFHSAAGANLLVDDGAGPASSFSGALIYTLDGGTVWKCITSKGASQLTNTSTKTAGGSSPQKLRVEFQAVGDSSQDQGECTFFVDDLPLYDAAQTDRNKPIKHTFTYTSAVAMNLALYVKAGNGTSQTVKSYGIGAVQTRTNWPGN